MSRRRSILGSTVGGRFQILKLLGSGGIGEVYMAEHKELRSPFAVKVLRRELAGENEVGERFRREAMAASRIQHRNIVYITDFGQLEDGRLYLVMEYLEGDSLQNTLDKEGPLDIVRALKIASQVADALRCAHEFGVIHRDLKPDNIMLVAPPGRHDVVKLIDFGLAKLLDNSAKRLTADGAVFGTPHNMSPEQTQGHQVDHRTDIYSFGTVLYECLTRTPPFEAEDIYELLVAHQKKLAESPSSRLKEGDIFPELDQLVMRCLEKDPDARYQDFDDVLSDLGICERLYQRELEENGFVDLSVDDDEDWSEKEGFSEVKVFEDGSEELGGQSALEADAVSEKRRRSSQVDTIDGAYMEIEVLQDDGSEEPGLQGTGAEDVKKKQVDSVRNFGDRRDSMLVPGGAWTSRTSKKRDSSLWDADTEWAGNQRKLVDPSTVSIPGGDGVRDAPSDSFDERIPTTVDLDGTNNEPGTTQSKAVASDRGGRDSGENYTGFDESRSDFDELPTSLVASNGKKELGKGKESDETTDVLFSKGSTKVKGRSSPSKKRTSRHPREKRRRSSEWWHDDRTLRMLQEIGNELREQRLAPPELLQVLISIYDQEERLLASATRATLKEDNFRELEDSYRERLGRLRRAVIELNLEKAFLVDKEAKEADDNQRMEDLGYQVGVLERRLHELEMEEKVQLAALDEAVGALREEVKALQEKLLGRYHKLLSLVEQAYCMVEDETLLGRYQYLDSLMRGII